MLSCVRRAVRPSASSTALRARQTLGAVVRRSYAARRQHEDLDTARDVSQLGSSKRPSAQQQLQDGLLQEESTSANAREAARRKRNRERRRVLARKILGPKAPPTLPESGGATPDMKMDGIYGVVTTSRPVETTIEELTRAIKPTDTYALPNLQKRPALLVLLMTPGLARYAQDKSVPDAVFKRFRLSAVEHGSRFRIITAIVDRIPSSLQLFKGDEGLAYMFVGSPPQFLQKHQTLYQPSAQKPGSLKFCIPRSPGSLAPGYDVQLPLAQTIFTTGSVSHLFERRYTYDIEKDQLEFQDEKQLESQALKVPSLPTNPYTFAVQMPLVALTPPRRIHYVMGNIVRKLSSYPSYTHSLKQDGTAKIFERQPDDTNESMSASQELETAVSSYFESLNLQPEPVSVWALVIPRDLGHSIQKARAYYSLRKILSVSPDDLREWWSPDAISARRLRGLYTRAIRTLLPHGARLIKVLSGGGGWGKKAGLLSLDPDVEYSTRELRQDDGWQFDFDKFDGVTEEAAEAQKKRALGEIVKQGEDIMFFLAPGRERLPPFNGAGDEEAPLSLSFGTIPSSIDDVPKGTANPSPEKTIRHVPGFFGMLSEGGMAMTTYNRELTNQTKLDVPFGRAHFLWKPDSGPGLGNDTSPFASRSGRRGAATHSRDKSPEEIDETITTEVNGSLSTVEEYFESSSRLDNANGSEGPVAPEVKQADDNSKTR
ncbi:hypothetical protein WHR41_06046 [Cladosporium halotolerans]|uniref:Uncharacterized protein n=1 Tax=Cladosporium halotolerans TaxID=1052096 RepID=A0AB34KKD5_9PEZI